MAKKKRSGVIEIGSKVTVIGASLGGLTGLSGKVIAVNVYGQRAIVDVQFDKFHKNINALYLKLEE